MTQGRAPQRADIAIAFGTWAVACGLLLAAPLLEAADQGTSIGIAPWGTPDWWLTVVTISLQAVALPWVRRWPHAGLLAVCAIPLLASHVLDEAAFSLTRPAIAVAVFLSGFATPLRHRRVTVAAAAVLVAVGEFVNQIGTGHSSPVGAVGQAAAQTVVVVVAPLLLASLFAARREAREAHLGELRAVAHEQDALFLAAVAGERASMARELHDIAAHHLSGIAVIAAAVERQIDTDPEAARHSVREVRAQSKAVLDDLRRLVGLLREEPGAERSVQTLAAASDLVRDRKAAGMSVDMRTLTGKASSSVGDGVGPLAQLVAYRMVQESLTNAAIHAPGAACRVEIDDRDADALTVTVTNARAPTALDGTLATAGRGGFGLLGMRERAGLVAGTLRYGITAEGGWAVVLRIPRDDARGTVTHGPDEVKVSG